MRDITEWLVPEGDAGLTAAAHHQFLDHMAQLHQTFWGWTDDVGLCTSAQRWTVLSPTAAVEAARGTRDPVPLALPGGWAALQDTVPEAWKVAVALADDPTPLVAALAELPRTLVHGDWKGGNLGLLPGGRTALVYGAGVRGRAHDRLVGRCPRPEPVGNVRADGLVEVGRRAALVGRSRPGRGSAAVRTNGAQPRSRRRPRGWCSAPPRACLSAAARRRPPPGRGGTGAPCAPWRRSP